MVIGFCGRMRSGKTELANICEAHGYEKLSFALPLKHLSCKLLGMTMDELNENKNAGTTVDVSFTEAFCREISEFTSLPPTDVEKIACGRKTSQIRDFLQFLGTDIIRACDNDWHVKRVMEMIEPGKDYVIDDVRFTNELQALRKAGADLWFIIRPQIDVMSSHPSETSIKWQDCFPNIILNTGTLSYLKFRWENYMSAYGLSCKARETKLELLKLSHQREYDEETEALFLEPVLFDYSHHHPLGKTISSASITRGVLTVKYGDGTYQILSNPLSIEDMKQFLPTSS